NGWFITMVTILAILLTVLVLFSPEWLTGRSIFLFISLYIVLGFIISIYTGFTTSGNLKTKMDGISVVIKHFANGTYSSRLNYVEDSDEVTRIGDELNDLGEKLEKQVKSLQR